MIAFVTSIGEPTTELCMWSLERNGFEVKLLERGDSLAKKLASIYKEANEDFIRVDADVVPNKKLTPEMVRGSCPSDKWWVQYMTYDWYKQDLTHGGVQYIKKEALPYLRDHVHEALNIERPETYMYRLKPFNNPRRCISNSLVMGLHNFKNDTKRVKETKTRRNQLDGYDFELAERLSIL